MYGLVSSVIINVILFSVLVFVNRKEKEKQERIKKVKAISESILNNQILSFFYYVVSSYWYVP